MNPNQTPNQMPTPTPVPAPMPTPVVPTPAPQIPITPKPPMPTPMKTPSSSPKALYWIIAVIIVAAVIYVLLNRTGGMMQGQSSKATFTNENVKVADTTSTPTGPQLPVGFPTSTPAEVPNIISSNTIAYPDKNAVLYSVDYISVKPAEEIFSLYGKYLKAGNYAMGQVIKTPILMSYQAISSKGRMYVVITPRVGSTLVQVSYTVQTNA